MGVLDLQKLVKSYGRKSDKSTYSRVIIDGNNLVFSRIASVISQMNKRNNIIHEFDGFTFNVVEQLKRIISMARAECIRVINSYTHVHNSIHIIFDPDTTPLYKIRTDMLITYDTELSDTEFNEFLLEDKEELIIKLKEDEQNKRKDSQSNKTIQKSLEAIDKLSEDETTKEILKKIVTQSSYFKNVEGYKKLIKIVAMDVQYTLREQSNIYFYQSNIEADLSIKNLGIKLLKEGAEDLLILSDDTDYFILFGDTENVYCQGISRNGDQYEAISIFRRLFGEHYSYDYVVRLSPILGNDYTVHSKLCGADDVDRVLALFGFNNKLKITGLKSLKYKSTIKKVVTAENNVKLIENLSEEYSPIMIDKIIKNYDEAYFRRYIISVLTYLNIESYSEDYYRTTITEQELMEKYEAIHDMVQEKFGQLYDWTYTNSIHNKIFRDSITELELPQNLFELTHTLDIPEDMPEVLSD